MATLRIYTEDLQIAKSLINRDERVTRDYYYKDCYPLFKSIYDNYYTDCKCCKEFMDEIYIVVLAPSKITGKCQMENFRGESTLRTWLKTACLYYCYNRFKLKPPIFEPLPRDPEKKDDDDDVFSDRKKDESLSNPIDFSGMNRADVETLLNMMPNTRYRNIIRLLYLEQKTHKEVAEALGMSMANYYNKRILAEKQYMQVCRKEEANV